MSELVEIVPRVPLAWSVGDDGIVTVRDLRTDEPIRYSAATLANLDALVRSRDLDEYHKRLGEQDARAAAQARAFVFALAGMGYVELRARAPPGVEVVRQLGAGAVGVAFLCRVDGEEVVVKRAWDVVAPLAHAHVALRREADALAALSHPRIPAFHGLREIGGHLCLLRGYVDGARLAPDRARVEDALALVAHVHARGHLLVDHAPWNYLVTKDGLALIDVGHARPAPAEGLTLARAAGTPGYIAPETLARGALTTRSDVWGVGRLAAFLLQGKAARKHDTLDGLVAGLAPSDAAFIRGMCADDPALRPADGAAALRLWQQTHAR